MRTQWKEIPGLLLSPVGRIQVRQGIWGHASFALVPLARLYRSTLLRNTSVTAVVGTYGKTTTTRAIAGVLGLPAENYVGWNSGSFLASAVLRTSPAAAHTVFEVSISCPGMGTRHARIVQPNIVVVTSVGTSHHTSMKTIQRARDEKAEMVRSIPSDGVTILNVDDPNVRWMSEHTEARVVTYGLSPSADYRASAIKIARSGTSFMLTGREHSYPIALRLIGEQMVYPALAAIAVAAERRIPLQRAISALEDLSPAPRRLEPITLPSGQLVLDDSCQSGFETVSVALQVLKSLPATRRVLIIGDLTEPLRPQGPQYIKLGGEIAAVADYTLHLGAKKAFNRIRAGARGAGMAESAIEHASECVRNVSERVSSSLRPDDVVLIKGRRGQHLERVSLLLREIPVKCDLSFCHLPIHCGLCPRTGHM